MPTIAELLAAVDSAVTPAKRRIVDALMNPKDYAAQTFGNVADRMQGFGQDIKTFGQENALRNSVMANPQAKNQALGNIVNALLNVTPVGIVPPKAAIESGVPVNLPGSEEFLNAVKGTPSAQMTPEGLMMRVTRNQAPEQGMMPSVRGGVFYLPEGATQAKYYSTGKNGYGGSEKIAGETLVRNPLFVKGATGGKAPEAAYDQLIGRGAYQSMRNDALKSLGTYGTKPQEKAALAEEFLAKYAPDLKGMGSYIVENSKQGNQLAYALQEAAVGSAVRKAGNDAVLGYSKGKAGPFLSELFDVRESAYPDKFGGYQLHDKFER